MNFKNIKLKNLLVNLLITLIYPIVKLFISNNKIIAFSDSCFILGVLLSIVGTVNLLVIHGDLDITGFILQRSLNKNTHDYQTFKKDQDNKRKDSFNYPLLCGIILIIISYITSLFA